MEMRVVCKVSGGCRMTNGSGTRTNGNDTGRCDRWRGHRRLEGDPRQLQGERCLGDDQRALRGRAVPKDTCSLVFRIKVLPYCSPNRRRSPSNNGCSPSD